MKLTAAALATLTLAAAACRTPTSPSQTILPEPIPARVSVQEPSAETMARIRQADEVLGEARTAALAGDSDEFAACEAVLTELLCREGELITGSPGLTALAIDAIAELDRLADALAQQQENGSGEESDEGEEAESEAVPADLEPVGRDRIAEIQGRAAKEVFSLPVVINEDVTALIDFYTGRHRERFAASLQRAADYLPFIRDEMRKASLPEDLAFLPLIESGFNPRARSRARAQGLWQFMKGTARLYELRVDSVVDERNDPYLATHAAVRHLQDLWSLFGDWELVLAAYNSGAGRVQRAMARSKGGTDYWSLRRHLPRETRNYVPAMWAALVVAKSPEAFDFQVVEGKPLCLERIPVTGALDLEVLAERTGIPVDELDALNPALVHRLTPAHGTYQLAVPCGFGPCAAETLAAIPTSERIQRVLYTVKKGDTPSGIARRFGSTVNALVAANSPRILRNLKVGATLVVPRSGVPTKERATSRRTTSRLASGKKSTRPGEMTAPRQYVVRKGDTLYDIARRYGTTAAALQRRNKLSSTRIHPGKVLIISD